MSNPWVSRSLCILIYIHLALGTLLICFLFSGLASSAWTWVTGLDGPGTRGGRRPEKDGDRRDWTEDLPGASVHPKPGCLPTASILFSRI